MNTTSTPAQTSAGFGTPQRTYEQGKTLAITGGVLVLMFAAVTAGLAATVMLMGLGMVAGTLSVAAAGVVFAGLIATGVGVAMMRTARRKMNG